MRNWLSRLCSSSFELDPEFICKISNGLLKRQGSTCFDVFHAPINLRKAFVQFYLLH